MMMMTKATPVIRTRINQPSSAASIRLKRQQLYLVIVAYMAVACGLLWLSRQLFNSSSSDSFNVAVNSLLLLHSNISNSNGHEMVVGDILDVGIMSAPDTSKQRQQRQHQQQQDATETTETHVKENKINNEDKDEGGDGTVELTYEKGEGTSSAQQNNATTADTTKVESTSTTTTSEIVPAAVTKTATTANAAAIEEQALPKELGTVVLLAPQRNSGSFWNMDRFCLFLRAVRSVDQYLNSAYGPYPIHVLLSKDYHLDPEGKDGPYTDEDRALIRQWAPNSTIHFVEIDMYSNDAFEAGVTMEQALAWKKAMPPPFFHGVGYASMCRLWSGRLQQMDFLQRYEYYMRMDDDSLLVETVPYDPFLKMKQEELVYVYRRAAHDHWGVPQLWKTVKSLVSIKPDTPFVHRDTYTGMQPYNNFHVTAVSFWTSPEWMAVWNAMNQDHLFYQYRVGDANVHAIACMFMKKNQIAVWSSFPYRHNSNDYSGWAPPEWRQECEATYAKHLPLRTASLAAAAAANVTANMTE